MTILYWVILFAAPFEDPAALAVPFVTERACEAAITEIKADGTTGEVECVPVVVFGSQE